MRIEGGGQRAALRRNFDSDSRRCHFERSREISIAVRKSARMRYSRETLIKSQSQIPQEFLYMTSS